VPIHTSSSLAAAKLVMGVLSRHDPLEVVGNLLGDVEELSRGSRG
jgi:hypothetical protein